jgi:putative transposase
VSRKTFAFKAYRSKKNRHLHQQINIGGIIHNHCIALCRRYYRMFDKHLPANRLKAHIAKLKHLPKYAFWNTLGSQAIQDIIERIDRAYQRFFSNVKDRKAGKTTERIGPPGFRKVRKAKSFTLKQAGYRLLGGNRLRIGKHVYQFSKSREIGGDIKTLTIKRDPLGDIYLYFSCLCEDEEPNRTLTGQSVGFDFGLKTFLHGSDGSRYESPGFFKQSQNEVARANRSLSRKLKGSSNRRKAQRHLARVHKRVANKRQSYHWELASELCTTYDVIYLEDLNLRGMKHLWGRKVSDLGFASFVSMLHYVASKTGTVVHHIDRWFPSTKLCPSCGTVNDSITLRDREWTCSCGAHHDRDLNAAKNIHREGASSLGVGSVRLASASMSC